jgi:uncharacterized protein
MGNRPWIDSRIFHLFFYILEVSMKIPLGNTVKILMCTILTVGVWVTPIPAKIRFVTIGSGGTSGLYYLTAGAIAKMVNQKRSVYDLSVSVRSTQGSVANLNALEMGEFEFGLVQSDRQYHAWKGIKDWEDTGPQEDLRAVCSFYHESVSLLAADDAGIQRLVDLRGKIVNIGNPGSGHRGNAKDALRVCSLDRKTDMRIENMVADQQARALVDGRLDAFFYTVGHPNRSIRDATSGKRKVHFVPLEDPCIDDLIAKWPFYSKTQIPIRFYPRVTNKADVATFSVRATLCTSARLPDRIVYALTKEIFENIGSLKELHPVFVDLTAQSMRDALTAPLHPGAVQYYKEVGWIK